ncbi:interferon lambda-2 [Peromyscus maniculatus bairdii]|uniref:interferon lambda-2 n=1 Tax=Peromyscus maniculatus bairdii TaxID=230844 RepID=UPI003FD4AAE8
MKPETAGGRVLLLLLLAAVLTGTRADPVPRATRLPPDAKDCHRARFKSLSPQVLQAFRKAKDAIEEWLRKKDVSCSSRLFPRAWDLQQLQVQERPRALQAELALTLKVLENMTDSALVPILDQPLHTLRHIHSQLQACTQPQPTAEPRPVSRRLSRWLHRLQEAQKKETPSCLEDSVTSNLFRLLIRDLKCVASGDHCCFPFRLCETGLARAIVSVQPQCRSFYDWLISLTMMSSEFITDGEHSAGRQAAASLSLRLPLAADTDLAPLSSSQLRSPAWLTWQGGARARLRFQGELSISTLKMKRSMRPEQRVAAVGYSFCLLGRGNGGGGLGPRAAAGVEVPRVFAG